MIVFELIVKHQTIVSVTETSVKMASTLCQKLLIIFCQKAQKIVHGFVQILPACGPNTDQIKCMERL